MASAQLQPGELSLPTVRKAPRTPSCPCLTPLVVILTLIDPRSAMPPPVWGKGEKRGSLTVVTHGTGL